MSVRIGRTIIDTSNWSVEDYDVIIRDLRTERARAAKARELKNRMISLISDAKDAGFDFVDKDFGNILTVTDFELYDNK